jgi:hypothetical protein
MKKVIIASLLLTTSLQIFSESVPMIINRTGQEIKVAFAKNATGDPLFDTGNEIILAGSADHASDKMILIPSKTITQPGLTNKYQNDAVKATVKIGAKTVDISSFAPATSYVIEADPATAGAFKATAGLATYDTASGVATYGSPSPAVPGSGF